MTTTSIDNPFPYFTDVDGKELENGKIYIGVAGLDAETNPITAYWDQASTIPAAQPIRTNAGYPDNAGSASNFFAGPSFSITVRDADDTLVFSKLVNVQDSNVSYPLRSDLEAAILAGLSLGDGSVVTAGGLQYEAQAGATTLIGLPGFIPLTGALPYPDHWGAVRSQSLSGADGIADSLAEFQAMLAYTGNGTINLLGGYYRISATLDVTNEVIFKGLGARRSLIHGNFTSGSIVRFYNMHSGMEDCGVTGGAARQAAALDVASPGVLLEAIDDAGETGRMMQCSFRNSYSFGHPGSGIYGIGPALTGDFINVEISSCKSHGFCFDRGQAAGRVNLLTSFIGGVCTILGGRISNCGGHYIACGRPDDAFSTPVLRVRFDNAEGGNNSTDPTAVFEDAAVYLRGTGFIMSNCGLSHPTSMAYVSGRNIRLEYNRWLNSDGTGSAYTVATYDELSTDGIFIENVNIISPGGPLDPLVAVTVPAGETIEPKNIFLNQSEMGNITSLIKTDATMGSGGANRVPGLILNGDIPVVRKTANQTVNNSTSTISDNDLTFWMMESERVFFRLTLIVDGSQSADLRWLINKPVGASVQYGSPNSIKATVGGGVSEVSPVTTGVITSGLGGLGTDRFVDITGFCDNGANPGNITLQWAQLVAEANDLTIKAGSVLEVKRLLS